MRKSVKFEASNEEDRTFWNTPSPLKAVRPIIEPPQTVKDIDKAKVISVNTEDSLPADRAIDTSPIKSTLKRLGNSKINNRFPSMSLQTRGSIDPQAIYCHPTALTDRIKKYCVFCTALMRHLR